MTPGTWSTDGAPPWLATGSWRPCRRRPAGGCGPWPEACPERRDLVHGDLLHGNVLVSLDARRVEAVLSWKCSVRGDFLFDAAWCSFWAPFHPGVAAADPLSGLLQDPGVRAEPGALRDAAARHHCYELHIGFTHLGWNVWTGNQAALAATARRLAEVLERGPLPLAGQLRHSMRGSPRDTRPPARARNRQLGQPTAHTV